MADGNGVLPAKSNDIWIDGYRANASTTRITPDFTPPTTDVSVISSTQGQIHKDVIDGNLNIDLFYKEDAHEDHVARQWDSGVAGARAIPIVVAHGNQIRVGEVVSIICVQPQDMNLSAEPKNVLRLSLTATWDGAAVTGVLQSTQTADGNLPMVSTETTDYAVQAISNRGPDTHTQTVSVSAASTPIGIIGTIGSQIGSDASRATVTFNLPLAWQTGVVPNSADNMTIRVTHKGVPRATRVFYGGDQLSTIFNEISDFQWDDGFEINHESTTRTQVTFTANRFGTAEDMVWDNTNPAPFRGTYTGLLGGVGLQVETATGTGGSRIYIGQGLVVDADEHDLPVSAVAIAQSAAQIGIRVVYPEVDLLSPAYNFSVRYNLSYVIDRVYS